MSIKLIDQEGGFTLIELLVTIAILAAMFGIVSIAMGGVGSTAQSDACNAEYRVVKSAINIYMAENLGVALNEGTNTTISNTDGQFAVHLRGTTVGLYSWTSTGVLTAGTCPAPVPTQPWGCGPAIP